MSYELRCTEKALHLKASRMKETESARHYKRYSEAFKLSVIRDIEGNHLALENARKKCEICGSNTIRLSSVSSVF